MKELMDQFYLAYHDGWWRATWSTLSISERINIPFHSSASVLHPSPQRGGAPEIRCKGCCTAANRPPGQPRSFVNPTLVVKSDNWRLVAEWESDPGYRWAINRWTLMYVHTVYVYVCTYEYKHKDTYTYKYEDICICNFTHIHTAYMQYMHIATISYRERERASGQ